MRPSPAQDVIVVGAGPAGLAAAATAAERGLRVLLLDEQSAPGGRVWHAAGAILAEARAPAPGLRARLAAGYDGAQAALDRLDASGVVHERRATVIDVAGPEGEDAGATVTFFGARRGRVPADRLGYGAGARRRDRRDGAGPLLLPGGAPARVMASAR